MSRRRRSQRVIGPFLFALALAAVVPLAGAALLRGVEPSGLSDATPMPSPTATPRPPTLTFDPPPGAAQAPRLLEVAFSSTRGLDAVALSIAPDPPTRCAATLESATKGRVSCEGLLAGATDYRVTLALVYGPGRGEATYSFRTMGDRLLGVRWFTEFEDPTGDPLACAAASCRIAQLFNAGRDPMSAEQILAFGRQFNRSLDPGLDPAAIAEVLHRLDPRSNYHYYVFGTRQEATTASVYWLLRSGKPVIAITLAGQHAPVVIGYAGRFGASYADPANRIDGLVVLDPQRGDLDPRTASRRPDKYRSPAFQTGALIATDEWLTDEWWLGFPYATVIQYAGRTIDIERNDGAYPRPHWGERFVILADDGDREWSSDREGRVRFR